MKKLFLFSMLCIASVLGLRAQTDVTSQYLTNANFSQGTPITVGVCTYDKDKGTNHTDYAQLVPVEGWDIPANGDARAGGLVAFGSGVWIGGPGYTAPATDSDGNSEGNILGLVGVWGGTAQYTQDVTLPAGTYTIVLGIYNSQGGTTAFTKNLIGFIEDGGTEHLAATKNYSVNTWKYEFITFTLSAQTSGKISLGYQGSNVGSGSAQHLFLSGLTIFNGEVDAQAYEEAKEAARNAKELEANRQRLSGSSFLNPSEDLLVNGSFDTANQGWTLTNMGYQQNSERPTRYVEKWQGSALTGNGSATQTIKNLPAGAYILTGTVQTNQAENGGAKLKVNGTELEVSGTWTEYTIEHNQTADGDVTVSFEWSNLASNWVAIDGFSLVYGGDYAQYMSDKEALGHKKAWEDAKAAAVAALSNEAYANVTGSEKTALQTEINKAEPTSATGYDNAAAALQSATETFTAAKAGYDAFVNAKAIATPTPDLAYATSAKKTAVNNAKNVTAPTTAEDAATKAAAISTALRAYYESHAAAENVNGAVDKTSAITNGTDPTNNDGWTWSGNKNNPRSNEPWTDADGTSTHSYFDGGNWSAQTWTTTMEQTISIPAGRYLLTAKGRAAVNTTFKMEAGGQSVDFPHIGASVGTGVFDRGWNDASVEFETDGSNVVIKVTASTQTQYEWFSISNFRLVQLEAIAVPMADASDYQALAAAITAAEAKTLGFDANEYAPYMNAAALKALAAAKAIDPEAADGNTKEVVTNATQALKSATWTMNTKEVDAIYDGQFVNTEANTTSGDINLPGWTKVNGIRLLVKDETTDPGLAYTDGKAAVFSWGGTTLTYGEQAGYTLPLNKHELYELTLKVSGWRDGDMPNVVTVTLDGVSESVNAQALGAKAINISEGNPFATLTFYLKPAADIDNSILTIYGNHHFTIADLSLKIVPNSDVNKLGDIVNSVLGKRQNYSGKSGATLSDVTKFVNKYLK